MEEKLDKLTQPIIYEVSVDQNPSSEQNPSQHTQSCSDELSIDIKPNKQAKSTIKDVEKVNIHLSSYVKNLNATIGIAMPIEDLRLFEIFNEELENNEDKRNALVKINKIFDEYKFYSHIFIKHSI